MDVEKKKHSTDDVQQLLDLFSSGPVYYHGLTLVSAWICNHIHHKVLDEFTYQVLNFNGATVKF